MKKSFTLLFAMAATVISSADAIAAEPVNCFGQEGSAWLVEEVSTSTPYGPVSFYQAKTEGKYEKAGHECFGLWGGGTNGNFYLKAFVYADGQKVYFLGENDSEWNLMYDFGLQPGESAVITSMEVMSAEGYKTFTMECKSIEPVEGTDIQQMKMQISSEGCDYTWDTVWLQGLGSKDSPFVNVNEDIQGYGSFIVEATSGEDLLYKVSPFFPGNAYNPNYFGREGSTWTDASADGQETVYCTGAPAVVNNKAAYPIMKMNGDGEPVATGYHFAVTMERVFLAAPDNVWLPVYDFNIPTGSTSSVYGNIDLTSEKWDAVEYEAKCSATQPLADGSDLQLLSVELTPKSDALAEGQTVISQKWISGVGSVCGMVANDVNMTGDVTAKLMSLKFEGETVYEYSAGVGVKQVDDTGDADMLFDLMGRPVREPQQGQIYISTGKKFILAK